jgi:hypothetical protein
MILDAVKEEIGGIPLRSGDLETVLRHGKTRRAAHRVGMASGAVAVVALIAGFVFVSSPSFNQVASGGALSLTSIFDVPVFDDPVRTEGALVYQAKPGPIIAVDTAQFGSEVVVESRRPEAFVVPVSDNPINALQADRIVYLGDLEGAQLALQSFNGKTCVYLGNGTQVTGGGLCVTAEGLAGGSDYVDPPVGSWLAWTQLPETASVVVGETGDGSSYWQRVVGRTVVFILPDGSTLDPSTLSALDASGNEVATTRGKDLDLAEIGFWEPSATECPADGSDAPVPGGC